MKGANFRDIATFSLVEDQAFREKIVSASSELKIIKPSKKPKETSDKKASLKTCNKQTNTKNASSIHYGSRHAGNPSKNRQNV
jgi:hypothetical protein